MRKVDFMNKNKAFFLIISTVEIIAFGLYINEYTRKL